MKTENLKRKGAKHFIQYSGIELHPIKFEMYSTDGSIGTKKTADDIIANLWINSYKDPSKINSFLSGYLKNTDIWIMAYQLLSENKGSLTAGPDGKTIEDINLKKLVELQEAVINGEYEWGGGKKVYILEPISKNKKGLSTSTFDDRVVQMVLKLLLEPIYESSFSRRSYGFRKGRSPHTALKLMMTTMKQCKWFVQVDIKQFFDKISYKKLLYIMKRKVRDKKILRLIEKGMKAKIFQPDGTITDPVSGTPKGCILSPLLLNIYLNELDRHINEIIKSESKYKYRQDSPKNPVWTALKRARKHKEVMRVTRSDPFTEAIYIEYIRYGDDFLVGITGPRSKANEIMKSITIFLDKQLKLEINKDKSRITHISQGIEYLGFVFAIRMHIKKSQKTGKSKRHSMPYLKIDLVKYKDILKNLDFCDGNGKPKPCFKYLRLPQSETNRKINATLRGISEWFKIGANYRHAMSYMNFIMRHSAAKMYAAKFKLGNRASVFKIGRNNLGYPIKGRRTSVGLSDCILDAWSKNESSEYSEERMIEPILFTGYNQINRNKYEKSADLPRNWKPVHEKLIEEIIKTGKPVKALELKKKFEKVLKTEPKSIDPFLHLS
uniref:Putative reverse transcriptase/maturase n=1 Tax=Bulboplastis apyrenoidosa TaxID=1070855 RepID=A0A1Y9TMC0_9RHOD|nr:putative reverse transcriptase/maturase [Bulboplastis apyrenoidosa]ARO90814.1 putative reverse transcriptase/maturase [Bulboplastis apyrenoidosa]